MSIPGFQNIMLPLLQFAADGHERALRETIDNLADQFDLTPDERRQILPSGRQAAFDNRIGWARTYLKKAGLLEYTRRGYYRITDRAQQVLAQHPTAIDINFLRQYKEFRDFQKPRASTQAGVPVDIEDAETPEEQIEAAYQQIRQGLADELLQTIKGCSPAFFERLVVDLLVKMGYGGTRKDAGQAIGGTGDGGIDGIIKEDRLGLDIIYIQAKRWDGSVSRPEVQKFAGALQGQRARKGILITTSSFTRAAEEYVALIDSKITLIDGDTLAQLLIDYDIGVTTFASYTLKRVDSDYFTEG